MKPYSLYLYNFILYVNLYNIMNKVYLNKYHE